MASPAVAHARCGAAHLGDVTLRHDKPCHSEARSADAIPPSLRGLWAEATHTIAARNGASFAAPYRLQKRPSPCGEKWYEGSAMAVVTARQTRQVECVANVAACGGERHSICRGG